MKILNVRLTDFESQAQIDVNLNPKNIIAGPNSIGDGSTFIDLQDEGQIRVKESPEEIATLIGKSKN